LCFDVSFSKFSRKIYAFCFLSLAPEKMSLVIVVVPSRCTASSPK
jgi:hypothetical protein